MSSEDLFRSMYNRYYARMLRFFRREFRFSQEDAEELTQDSFVRFYRSMRDYRGEAEWGLLETIARNVAYNHARSLATLKRGAVKTESMSDFDPQQEPPAGEEHPLDKMIEDEQKEWLRQAIPTLPKGERRCLQLRLEDWNYSEIARALRMSGDAVKSRIRDAKRLLRERLGGEANLPEDES